MPLVLVKYDRRAIFLVQNVIAIAANNNALSRQCPDVVSVYYLDIYLGLLCSSRYRISIFIKYAIVFKIVAVLTSTMTR